MTTLNDDKLPHAFTSLLVALHGARQPGPFDHTARVDRFGRLIAGGEERLLPGDAAAWLQLLAHGYIAWAGPKAQGRVRLAPRGEEEVERYLMRTKGGEAA